ncbi:hypothetical protein PALU110988_00570 [Paenibacillus lupini]|nr:hypothetical protein [Paenibacillus lupini]
MMLAYMERLRSFRHLKYKMSAKISPFVVYFAELKVPKGP